MRSQGGARRRILSGMDSTIAFTVRDALERGYTPAELRSMAYTRPARGVRITGADAEDADALFEAVRVLAGDDQFFSHTTAARIHGMPLPMRLESCTDVHIASPTGRSRMQRPGVIGHRLQSEVVEIDGMRVEARADTFIHLATLLTFEELVAVGDWLVSPQRAHPLTIEDLAATVRRYRGARGVGKARRAVAAIRRGAESPRETLTRLLIVGAGLPEPMLQHEVFDERGTFVGRLDLAWPHLRLAVEYDGEAHYSDRRQQERDIVRLRRLRELGWEVIQLGKRDLLDGGRAILATIRAAYERRASARVAA